MKDSKREKTNVKSKIFFQHSYPHRTAFLLEDKLKTRAARAYLLSGEVQKNLYKQGWTACLSRAIALHCVRSRIKNALSSRGHVRTNVLSAKNGPMHNQKLVTGTEPLYNKVNKLLVSVLQHLSCNQQPLRRLAIKTK